MYFVLHDLPHNDSQMCRGIIQAELRGMWSTNGQADGWRKEITESEVESLQNVFRFIRSQNLIKIEI